MQVSAHITSLPDTTPPDKREAADAISFRGRRLHHRDNTGARPACEEFASVLLYRYTSSLGDRPLFEQVDPRAATPLYAQIADGVRLAIARGELAAGDGLPSVRHLASELRINPATVSQAYRELEAEGLVEMRQGAGSFVADIANEVRQRDRTTRLRAAVRALLAEASRLGASPDDLRHALDTELGRPTK